jgi:uncharacterized membrane protein YhdT
VSALLGIFRKLSIVSALVVGWLIVLLLFVGWLIFAYDQAEALGFIDYVKFSVGVVNKPVEALDIGSVLRLVFAAISAVFAVILSVFTIPMFLFVYANVGYGKMIERLNRPKEAAEAETGAAGS